MGSGLTPFKCPNVRPDPIFVEILSLLRNDGNDLPIL